MFPFLRMQRLLFFRVVACGGLMIVTLICCLSSCSPDTKVSSAIPVLDSGADTTAYLMQVRGLQASEEPQTRLGALNALGGYYESRELFDSSLIYYQKALTEARANHSLHEEVRALVNVSWCYRFLQENEKAIRALQEAVTLSRQTNDTLELAYALQETGLYYQDIHENDSALKYLTEQLACDEALGNSSSMAATYCNMATIYSADGNYLASIDRYKRALAIAEKLRRDTAIADYNANLGIAYKEEASYDLALSHLIPAAQFYEKSGQARPLSTCYTAMGNTYSELGDQTKALEYHHRALQLRQQSKYKKGIAGSLNNIAEAHIRKAQYDTAIAYLEQALVIKRQLGDNTSIGLSLDLMGEAFFLSRDYERARTYYLQSLELKSQTNDPKPYAITLNNLGRLYDQWRKPDSAHHYLREGRVLLEKIQAKNTLLENYQYTTEVFRKQGNVDSALKYTDRYIQLKDIITNEEKVKAFADLEVKYETAQKEEALLLLKERDDAKAVMVDKQRKLIYSLIGGSVLLVVVILLLYKVVRSRRTALEQSRIIVAQKQTIIEQKQALMSELHHRIKNNLQVLSSLLELQQSRASDPATAALMQAIDQRLNAMLLIHQGLYGDAIGSRVNMQEYIDALIRNLCLSFGYSAERLNIRKSIAPLQLDADKALSLGFICNEVISNWFKHVVKNKEHAELFIEYTPALLRFSDNGPGGMNTQESAARGSFGMRLIQLFSQELNGKLLLHSDSNGTTITLHLS